MDTIGELVRKQESDYTSGSITVSKYVTESPYEDISKINAYLNSKHTSGDTDALGREKPFFNIVLAKKNITARATDLDRKNIRAKASKAKDELASFLYTIHVQRWMKESNFGMFLNNWGDYLAGFNSAIVKFVEKDGELHSMVMDWNNMIVDFINFDQNPKIEILELTEAQVRQRGYDKEVVDKLCEAIQSRRTLEGRNKDNKSNYIRLYEVHGNLPKSYLTGNEEDDDTYVQQMHIISFVASKEKGKFDDFTLYSGKEAKDPYMLTWLIPSVDGSISLNGTVKTLFDAQWMQNHTTKLIKDQLDLASKLIFQTSDSSYAGKNALSAIESGDIMVYKENMPLTQIQNNSHDISSLQAYGEQWKNLSQEITNTPDILGGENLPSGTAYRQAAIVQQEAHSNFDQMIENKGLHLEAMFREYITPFILKKMDSTEEISATLDAYGMDKIDKMYVASEAIKRFNQKAVQAVINRTQLPDLAQEQQQVSQELNSSDQRFIKPSDIPSKTWKKVIGEFEGDIVYEITDENQDKRAVLDTLSSMLQTAVNNPPLYKFITNKIFQETGVASPIEIAELESAQQTSLQAPQAPTASLNNPAVVGAGLNQNQ